MAYVTGALNVAIPRVGGGPLANTTSFTSWCYITGADNIAAVIADGYIDDGDIKGMKQYDVVTVVDTANETIDYCLVTVVGATASGDVTMVQLA
jgi:hypothetical protein